MIGWHKTNTYRLAVSIIRRALNSEKQQIRYNVRSQSSTNSLPIDWSGRFLMMDILLGFHCSPLQVPLIKAKFKTVIVSEASKMTILIEPNLYWFCIQQSARGTWSLDCLSAASSIRLSSLELKQCFLELNVVHISVIIFFWVKMLLCQALGSLLIVGKKWSCLNPPQPKLSHGAQEAAYQSGPTNNLKFSFDQERRRCPLKHTSHPCHRFLSPSFDFSIWLGWNSSKVCEATELNKQSK